MAHKYPNVLVHLVFSTQERANLIPSELLPRLWKYLAGIGRNHGIPVIASGGISNHVHLLIALPSDMTPAKAVQVLKANSSGWIRQHGIAFAWQEGYGAFSVSSSNKTAVVNYIGHQAEHHRVRSYETEFEAMIRKSGMRFDARRRSGRVPSLRDSDRFPLRPGIAMPGFPIPCLSALDLQLEHVLGQS